MSRDHHEELARGLEEWFEDLRTLAERCEFLFSVNDYAVLLRRRPGEGSPTSTQAMA